MLLTLSDDKQSDVIGAFNTILLDNWTIFLTLIMFILTTW